MEHRGDQPAASSSVNFLHVDACLEGISGTMDPLGGIYVYLQCYMVQESVTGEQVKRLPRNG